MKNRIGGDRAMKELARDWGTTTWLLAALLIGCGDDTSATGGSGTGAGNSGGNGTGASGATNPGGGAPGGGGVGGSASGGMSAGGAATGGAATGGGAPAGNALLFDGVDDEVLVTVGGGASETAFSAEVWFKTSSPTGMLVEVFSANPIGADRSLYLEAGKVCFYVLGGMGLSEACSAADTYADGAWHHAAGTLGSGGQKLYLDGAVAATGLNTSSTFMYDKGFRIGRGYIGPGGINGLPTYFTGTLDDVRIWSVERSGAEISANAGAPVDPTTTGLQAYWRLDESGSADMASDAVQPGVDGVLTGFSFTPSPWVPGAI